MAQRKKKSRGIQSEGQSSPQSIGRWLLAHGLVLLMVGAVVMGAIEFGLRILEPDYSSESLVLLDPRFGYPAEYDPLLGYVPRVGDHGEDSVVWEKHVVVLPPGIRSNGTSPIAGEPILVVGDSFTWGGWVNDAETWPAYLEGRLGQPVINGGVFGYGFDQIVLRAEQLVPQLHPKLLVVAFIPHDILRCEQSYRFTSKPYFDIEQGALVLRGVPPPRGQRTDTWSWLRWSHFADYVMGGLLGERWSLPQMVREHERGLDVARLLVARLSAIDTPILLVALGSPGRTDHAPARALLEYAKSYGLDTLDLEPPLNRHIESNPDALWEFFYQRQTRSGPVTGHMAKDGNAWVAEQVAARLSRNGADSMRLQ